MIVAKLDIVVPPGQHAYMETLIWEKMGTYSLDISDEIAQHFTTVFTRVGDMIVVKATNMTIEERRFIAQVIGKK